MIAPVPKMRSKRQFVSTWTAENGFEMSKPMMSSAGVMSALKFTGGGMRDRETATPTVAAMMSSSTMASRTNGRFHHTAMPVSPFSSASSWGMVARRWTQPKAASTIVSRALSATMRP
jgi:hypothetical protein